MSGHEQPFRTTQQHVTEGGRRLGEEYSYGSCEYHHLGKQIEGWSRQQMYHYGPSFAHGRKSFEERYGDERYILVRVQDMLCELQKAGGWTTAPIDALDGAKRYWRDLRRMN